MIMLSLSFPLATILHVARLINSFIMWNVLNMIERKLHKFDVMMSGYTEKFFDTYETEKTND